MTFTVPELSRCERLTTNDFVSNSSFSKTVLSSSEVVVVSRREESEREVGENNTVSKGVPGL
jgi:hypothetical protein